MTNLALKYRPKTFDDVTEQTTVVSILKAMCEQPELPNRCFLLVGPRGCGKTTSARIMANMLNGNSNETIEIDAASNSGVDSIRSIVQQAQTYPIGAKYKCFLVDECVTGDTEILTDSGWKRIDSISEGDGIAQYHDDGSIDFTNTWDYVDNCYQGDMYKFTLRRGKTNHRTVMMTPHHVQPLRMSKSKKIKEAYIQDIKLGQGNEIITAGTSSYQDAESLTPLEKLVICCQADGYFYKNMSRDDRHVWEVHLKKARKIERVKALLQACNILYKEYVGTNDDVSFRFVCNEIPINKKLSDFFDLKMSFKKACQFVDEILFWDGSLKSGYPGYYSCNDIDNVNFVSAVLTMTGHTNRLSKREYENQNHKTTYAVSWANSDSISGQSAYTEVVHDWSGHVYCVKVPTQKILLRANGLCFVSGNCHALSNTAWQALLKVLEDQPAKSVFILLTTNPEKIPATILSRVQKFQLSTISLQGIENRLKYVIDEENKEGRHITYEENAIAYIAKLAKGGMRDALTYLDKALVYSDDLTSENLQVSLGIADYSDYFNLLNAYARKDNEKIIEVVDKIYNSGTNFVKWFEEFQSFVINIVKYVFLKDINETMIPAHYADKLSKYGEKHAKICLSLSQLLVDMISKISKTEYMEEVALSYLLRR